MSDYRIVCVSRLDTSPEHRHVTDVGTENARSEMRRWSAVEVRHAMRHGDLFYTISPTTNEMANVEAFDCSCGLKTIRSHTDAIADNNLAAMPACAHTQSRATRLAGPE